MLKRPILELRTRDPSLLTDMEPTHLKLPKKRLAEKKKEKEKVAIKLGMGPAEEEEPQAYGTDPVPPGKFSHATYFQTLRCPPDTRPKIYTYKNDVIATQIRNDGLFEVKLIHRFMRFGSLIGASRNGVKSTFVDAGGNVGVYTFCAAAKDFSTITIEAFPKTAEKLAASVALNNYQGKIEVFNVALGDKMDKTGVCLGGGEESNMGLVRVVHARSCAHPVPFVTLDSLLMPKIDTNRFVLMKMDVEGFESAALKGARKLLTNDNNSPCLTIVEITHVGHAPPEQTIVYPHSAALEELTNAGFIHIGTYGYKAQDHVITKEEGLPDFKYLLHGVDTPWARNDKLSRQRFEAQWTVFKQNYTISNERVLQILDQPPHQLTLFSVKKELLHCLDAHAEAFGR